MDPKVKEGLKQFLQLSWPLMKDEIPNCPECIKDLDITLILGHTHKPIVEKVPIGEVEKGINISMPIYNTGGWVVDRADKNEAYGASIILMNRNLDLVSLQVYRQGGLDKVLPTPFNENTVYKYINKKINKSSDCWNKLIKNVNIWYHIKARDKAIELDPHDAKAWNDKISGAPVGDPA